MQKIYVTFNIKGDVEKMHRLIISSMPAVVVSKVDENGQI